MTSPGTAARAASASRRRFSAMIAAIDSSICCRATSAGTGPGCGGGLSVASSFAARSMLADMGFCRAGAWTRRAGQWAVPVTGIPGAGEELFSGAGIFPAPGLDGAAPMRHYGSISKDNPRSQR
jgi:hypothetical protein